MERSSNASIKDLPLLVLLTEPPLYTYIRQNRRDVDTSPFLACYYWSRDSSVVYRLATGWMADGSES
jgi:hypothetical protein